MHSCCIGHWYISHLICNSDSILQCIFAALWLYKTVKFIPSHPCVKLRSSFIPNGVSLLFLLTSKVNFISSSYTLELLTQWPILIRISTTFRLPAKLFIVSPSCKCFDGFLIPDVLKNTTT